VHFLYWLLCTGIKTLCLQILVAVHRYKAVVHFEKSLIKSEIHYCHVAYFPLQDAHLVEVRGLACLRDPRNYTGGGHSAL